MTRLAPFFLLVLACAVSTRGEGALFFDPRVSADGRDFQTGMQLGDEERFGRLRVSAFLDLDFWPLPRGTRVVVAEAEEYVIRDAWYAIGPGIGAAWPLAAWGLGTVAGGVSRALGGEGPGGWSPWVDAGYRFPGPEESYWAILYQYHPLENLRDHRIALQLRLRMI